MKWFTCSLRKKLTLRLRLNHPKILRTRNLYCGTPSSKLSRKPMSATGTFETSCDVRSVVANGRKVGMAGRSSLVANGPKGNPRFSPKQVVVSPRFSSLGLRKRERKVARWELHDFRRFSCIDRRGYCGTPSTTKVRNLLPSRWSVLRCCH